MPRRAFGRVLGGLVVQRCGTGDISGATVMAAVKAAHVADDPLAGQKRAIVKISFVDDKGKEFARAERHFLKAGGPDDRFAEGIEKQLRVDYSFDGVEKTTTIDEGQLLTIGE